MVRLRRAVIAAVALCAFLPSLAWGQAPKAGVVTTLEGNVTATRAAAPQQPVPLKFKDDVFLQDRITTGEQSLARMLLGGKAVVTVRERSVLTITEIPGRSTISIESGKFALAVARERLQTGEIIEIRTPNAIAGVRGTVVVTEVSSAPPAAAAQPPQVVSNLYVLRGDIQAQSVNPVTRAPIGVPRTINVLEQFRVVGLSAPVVTPISPGQLGAIRAGLQPKSQQHTGAANQEQVSAQAVQTAVALATTLSAAPTTALVTTPTPTTAQTTTAEPTTTAAPIIPPVIEQKTALETSGVLSTSLLTNGGFEKGDFTGWTLSGAGNVITSFGTLEPTEGKFMALIHTKTGSTLSGCSSGKDCTKTTLSQKFTVKSILTVKGKGALLSNEFPTFTSTKSSFNDKYLVQVIDSAGNKFIIFEQTVNDTSDFVATSGAVTVGTFTLDKGAGATEFEERKKTITTVSGEVTLEISVTNVSDSSKDSGFLLDALVVTQDPPLFYIRDGATFSTGSSPLLSMTGGAQTFDSLLTVCCGGSATLSGPALQATNSSLDVPFNLVAAFQGGQVTSTWPGAMVEVQGGNYNLGDIVGVFNVGGLNPSDQPLRHGGVFLDATNASVHAGAVIVIDNALLAASAPLLNLKNSTFVSKDHAVDLSYRATVTSLGSLLALNGSALVVNNGALVSLANGSVLSVSGNLAQLSNGSTLSLLNGPVAKIGGNSNLNVTGALFSFSGSNNAVNINNSLCSSFSCTSVGGLNVALTGGATAANVSISNAIKGSGTVSSSANAAAILLSGTGSKVTIGGN